ncbi:MAG: uroporphyrinogen-III synthase [Pseudomonadota bacterium]
MSPTLAGLRVLVTRPAHQAAGLVIKLEDAGALVSTLPLLAIAPPQDPEAARAALHAGANADFWIFTSANAVDGAQQLYGERWPATLFALGQGSVRALARHGHRAIAPEGGTSEDLLLWPELGDLQGKRVLIVTGEGGRQLLVQTLTARGAQVTLACCYRRLRVAHPPAVVQAALAATDVAVLTSGEALMAVQALADVSALPLLLPSQRVAQAARASGCKAAILLPAAVSDAAILARLEQWQRAPHNDHP